MVLSAGPDPGHGGDSPRGPLGGGTARGAGAGGRDAPGYHTTDGAGADRVEPADGTRRSQEVGQIGTLQYQRWDYQTTWLEIGMMMSRHR